jgi:hypothetical protein
MTGGYGTRTLSLATRNRPGSSRKVGQRLQLKRNSEAHAERTHNGPSRRCKGDGLGLLFGDDKTLPIPPAGRALSSMKARTL